MHTLHTWLEPTFKKEKKKTNIVEQTNKLNYSVYRLTPKEEK